MKRKLLSVLAVALIFTACGNKENEKVKDNPLLVKSSLDHGAPDFSIISNDDFIPAFEEGMRLHREEIDAIVNNEEAPTFENTILALEKAGKALDRTSSIFSALSGAHNTDEIKAIDKEITPKLAAHSNYISLNDGLFKRIQTVYENEYENLQGEDKKLLKEVYTNFVRQGAALEGEKKEKLEEINTRLATLQQEFEEIVTNGTNAAGLWIDNKEDLAGLSDAQIAQAEADAKARGEKAPYYLVVSNTTQQSLLASLDNRELRKKLYEASVHRCDPGTDYDTADKVLEIAKLRAEKANLLGYDTYADWRLENTMAKTPENVYSFFNNLIKPYLLKMAGETAEIQAYARMTEGPDFELEPYDRFYYSSKMKKEKFDYDNEEVKKYLVLDSVLQNGVFYAANKVFGISFEERTDLPVYHPEVRVYNVKDEDGSLIALFYTDYFRRETKRGGAWMSSFSKQSDFENQIPIIYNVCNFAKPAEGQPALISMDDVETMFHEFGHALHGMLSKCKYNTLSGTAVSRDFVEFPSQFNEYFSSVPEVFNNYAKHYETGEPMPEELKKKVQESSTFHSGYSLGENMAATLTDMAWHTKTPEELAKVTSVKDFQEEALKAVNLLDKQVPPRYSSEYFRHVFGGGYAAGYYSYLWSEVLAVNTGDLFDKNGKLSRETGDAYRNLILSVGDTKDLAAQFTALTGLEEPDANSLLRAKGLK